jgi:hypothetical protein
VIKVLLDVLMVLCTKKFNKEEEEDDLKIKLNNFYKKF